MYAKTQKLVEHYYQKGTYPSYSVAYLDGQTVQRHWEGWAQLEPTREPLVDKALYDLASLTKVIGTTTLVLQLLETEQLEVDAPISHYLPEFKDRRITVRQLLTHTSGVQYHVENRDQLTAAALKDVLLHAEADPSLQGKAFRYTDTGFLLLGFLVEEILHEPIQTAIKKRVLRPAGMATATFQPAAEHAVATEVLPQLGTLRGTVHDPKARILNEHCGSAGLFASLEDCLQFFAVLCARAKGQGDSVLQPATVRRLLQDYGGVDTPHSLGWRLRYSASGKPFLYHTGYTGTWLLVQPETGEGMIFLSNRVHPVDNRSTYLPIREKIVETFLNETKPL